VFEEERGPRARRRQATIDEIVAAAWDVVHEEGLAALSIRDLAARVGLSGSSLYQYFDSKHAIFDALFADGHRQLHDRLQALDWSDRPLTVFRNGSRIFTDFCLEDAVRYQLLFQRTIRGFVPSESSMALSWATYRGMTTALAAIGVTETADIDLWTAVQMGLTEQQLANDPGGRRFVGQLDAAIDMFLAHVKKGRSRR
jgi:AcrR family transcriptional regulator